MKKITSLFLVFVLMFTSLCANDITTRAESKNIITQMNEVGKVFRVLEIQPSNSYELSVDRLRQYGINNVELIQMPMSQFVATIDDLTGKYDAIYIGSKDIKVDGKNVNLYKHFGDKEVINSSYEYYKDNDITKLKSKELEKYINAGQLLIFSSNISYAGSDTNIKVLYDKYIYSNATKSTKANVVVYYNLQEPNIINEYQYSNKRPELILRDKPVEYNSNNPKYSSNILYFYFDAYSFDDANMKVNLYLDANGDGRYSDDEQVSAYTSAIKDGKGYTNYYQIPDDFVGIMPWKFELINLSTGTKDYETGYTAITSTKKQTIRLLQVYPNGSTFNIKNDLRPYFDSLKEYNVEAESISINDYEQRYVRNNKYTINGVYDILILGFADSFGNQDITNSLALRDIKDFINAGQSVIFTHDTINNNSNQWDRTTPSGWSSYLTKEFRNTIGQNRYNTIVERPYGQFSYGYTQMVLENNRSLNPLALVTTNDTYKINQGIINVYPYTVGDIKVQSTHYPYYQLDLESEDVIPWYTLDGSRYDKLDPRHYYYAYSKGNVTYIGAGHSSINNGYYNDEKKLFVNTIIKSARNSNHAPTLTLDNVQQVNNENIIIISHQNNNTVINFTPKDIDVLDRLLNGKIYIDKNRDGRFDNEMPIKEYSISKGTGLVSGEQVKLNIDIANEYFNKDNNALVRIEISDSKGVVIYKDVKITRAGITDTAYNVSLIGKNFAGDESSTIYINNQTKSISMVTKLELKSNTNYVEIILDNTDKFQYSVPSSSKFEVINNNIIRYKSGQKNLSDKVKIDIIATPKYTLSDNQVVTITPTIKYLDKVLTGKPLTIIGDNNKPVISISEVNGNNKFKVNITDSTSKVIYKYIVIDKDSSIYKYFTKNSVIYNDGIYKKYKEIVKSFKDEIKLKWENNKKEFEYKTKQNYKYTVIAIDEAGNVSVAQVETSKKTNKKCKHK